MPNIIKDTSKSRQKGKVAETIWQVEDDIWNVTNCFQSTEYQYVL